MSESNWRIEFKRLEAIDEGASVPERAARGRKFERVLSRMFDDEGLQPRMTFRPKGEEVDGSFVLGERHFLIEAKWTKNPQPASSLYSFKGKIDGKLVGTIGLFVSMSGYSEDAVSALIAGKSINLILMDGDDLRAIVDGLITGKEAILRKLRAAAENGTPHLPLVGTSGTGAKSVLTDVASADQVQRQSRFLVVVEGRYDELAIFSLAAARSIDPGQLRVISAGGRANLGRLAGFITEGRQFDRLIIVADGDNMAEQVRRDIYDQLEDVSVADGRVSVIVLDPTLEDAFGLNRQYRSRPDPEGLRDFFLGADLSELARRNTEIRVLLDSLNINLGASGRQPRRR